MTQNYDELLATLNNDDRYSQGACSKCAKGFENHEYHCFGPETEGCIVSQKELHATVLQWKKERKQAAVAIRELQDNSQYWQAEYENLLTNWRAKPYEDEAYNQAIGDAVKVIQDHEEEIMTHNNERFLQPRRDGNLLGIAFVDAILRLRRPTP